MEFKLTEDIIYDIASWIPVLESKNPSQRVAEISLVSRLFRQSLVPFIYENLYVHFGIRRKIGDQAADKLPFAYPPDFSTSLVVGLETFSIRAKPMRIYDGTQRRNLIPSSKLDEGDDTTIQTPVPSVIRIILTKYGRFVKRLALSCSWSKLGTNAFQDLLDSIHLLPSLKDVLFVSYSVLTHTTSLMN
jgi:hypothetical protein